LEFLARTSNKIKFEEQKIQQNLLMLYGHAELVEPYFLPRLDSEHEFFTGSNKS
jgi:hypothetical protein